MHGTPHMAYVWIWIPRAQYPTEGAVMTGSSFCHHNVFRNLSVKTANEFKSQLISAFDAEEIKTCHIELTNYCREIAARRSLVTVLSLTEDEESQNADGGTNLEENILKALLKGKKI